MLSVLMVNILNAAVVSDHSFITTWQTENAGSETKTIVIPTNGAGYDCYIDWGDGGAIENQVGTPGDITHVYDTAGIKTIKITGLFPNIYFNNNGDRLKLLSIEHWGNIIWGSTLNVAFYGCSNMNITATDAPDFSVTTIVSAMFRSCSVLNASIGHWDMSNITNITRMFNVCSAFNQDLGDWDVTSITVADKFLANCYALSPQNYGALLIGWAAQAVQSNVVFGADRLGYDSFAEASRTTLTDTYNWTITDAGSNFDNGKFVICFDDGLISNYSLGLPLFTAQGEKATFYINSNRIEQAGWVTWANLQEMDAAGMDIQDHFNDHTDMTTLTEQQVLDGLNDSNADFVANSLPSPNHLAYPFGAQNGTMRAWVETLRQTGRLATGSDYKTFSNSEKFILATLATDGLDAAGMTFVKSQIDQTKVWKDALITYSHDIDGAGISQAQLNELIDYAQAADVDIITMTELYALMD